MDSKIKIMLAEFIGTAMLLALGLGVVAMTVLFAPTEIVAGGVSMGGYTNIVLGWGLAVAFGVIVSFRVSGAHINPAVTIALASTSRLPWNQVPYYIIAQLLGAFMGALLVFSVFSAKWFLVDPNLENTVGILTTFPAVKGFLPGFIDQVVGTFILVYLILSVGNYIKNPKDNIAFPFVIGAIVLSIGISFGGMHGYAINPARDFAPRLFAAIMGFQNTGFESILWTVPILGPILGGILGAKAFDLTIKE